MSDLSKEVRVMRLIESKGYGDSTGRVAYSISTEHLPKVKPGMRWVEDTDFDEERVAKSTEPMRRAFAKRELER